MITDVFVDRHLHLELSRRDFAMASGVFFVDEFDGKDGAVFSERTSFFDAIDTT